MQPDKKITPEDVKKLQEAVKTKTDQTVKK